jgi:branched-chain amino acid transport system permease protein
MSLAFWEPILIYTMINAILALGFYVTLTSGMLSVAHAAAAGMAGYTAGILTTNFHWPFLGAVLVGICVAALVGAFLALVTIRMSLLVSSLVTLGFGETMSVIAYNIEYIGGANSFSGIPLYTNLQVAIAALLVTLYIVWRFEGSRMGFAARAVRDNQLAAAANGISILRVRLLAFSLGTALSGLAGAISAHYTLVVNPADLGFWPSFYIQVYVIFGGSYTMAGPVFGAVLLTPLTQLLRFADEYRFAVYGLVILLVILLRPQGVITRVPTGGKPRFLRVLSRVVRRPSADGAMPRSQDPS